MEMLRRFRGTNGTILAKRCQSRWKEHKPLYERKWDLKEMGPEFSIHNSLRESTKKDGSLLFLNGWRTANSANNWSFVIVLDRIWIKSLAERTQFSNLRVLSWGKLGQAVSILAFSALKWYPFKVRSCREQHQIDGGELVLTLLTCREQRCGKPDGLKGKSF